MSKSFKTKNNIFLDISSIVKNKEPLNNYIIVDSGTNENGEWIKFGNGWMICKQVITGNTFNCTKNLTGNFYFSDTNGDAENVKYWTFPQEFVNEEDLTVNVTVRSSAYSMSGLGPITKTYATGYCVLPYSVSNITFTWLFTAIGRWK